MRLDLLLPGSTNPDVTLRTRIRALEKPETNSLATAPASFSFSNGWRAYGAGVAPWGNVGYYRDSSGIVHLEGLLDKNGGNWVGNEIMLTLPPGFRPPSSRMFHPRMSGSTTNAVGRLDLASTGTLTLVESGANNPVAYLSLDGITFRPA